MQKLLWIALILGVSISCKKEESKVQPTIGTLTKSVYASVTVQPDSLYEVYSNVNGILDNNLVSECDLVKTGTPLFQIINTNTKLNTENARLAYDLALSNFEGNSAILFSIEDEIKAAQLKLYNDSISYFRQKNLWDQQIGSQNELDTKKLAYELSSNTVTSLQTKYSRTKNELKTLVDQAANSYKNSLITTKDYTISSKMNGKVYALFKNPGEIVSPQQPLATVGSENRFLLEMLVDEVDIVTIIAEQEVLVGLEAYPNKIFKARVSKIYPSKDVRNQTFKVEATFDSPPQTLYPGLSGEANILIDVKEDVLIIPIAYLMEGNKVNTAEGIIEVTIGLQNEDKVEILSGITAETVLLKPDKS